MLNRNLNNPIRLILKDSVGLVDMVEAEGVGDEWGCVDLALFDEFEDFCAVAAVYAAGLEG